MNTTSRRIQRLEEDLKEIKRTLDRNKSLIRQLLEKTFRFLPLLGFAGFSCALISIAYYLAIRAYGSFDGIPAVFHWAFVILIAVAIAVTSLLKLVILSREAKKIDGERSTYALFALFFKSSAVTHVFFPIMALIAAVSAFLIARDQAYYCVPVCAIGCGILWNVIGSGFSLPEYTVFGYWLLLTGTLSLFITVIHPLLWVALIFGIGFISFAAYLVLKGNKRDNDGSDEPRAGSSGGGL